MDAKLSLSSLILAYADVGQSNSPQLKTVDWRTSIDSMAVTNPKTQPFTIDPGDAVVLFSGVRTTGIDDDTVFDLELSALDASQYRFTYSSGTEPAFRVDRELAASGHDVTTVVNANTTMTMTADTSGEFTNVEVGDVLFIPGPTTGDDATEFNTDNEGYWTVLAKTGTTVLQLARPTGTDFVGVSETVTLTDDIQLQAFGSAGIQVGDKVNISDGFTSVVQRTYTVIAVNPWWFEVMSTVALPVAETATPTATGISFYSQAKRFVYILVTQEAVVRMNGDTGNSNQLSPWDVGDIKRGAHCEKIGPCWSLEVVNKASVPMDVVLITAE